MNNDDSQGAFKIVDLFQGSGTFIMIKNYLKIEMDQAINFGNNHITFKVSLKNNNLL